MDGNALTILYSNFTKRLLQVACVRRDDQNLIQITKKKRKKIKHDALVANPRRVSGEKEISSEANINFAAGFCQLDERRARALPFSLAKI